MKNLAHWIRYSQIFSAGSVRPRELLEQIGSPEVLELCGEQELKLFGMTEQEISRLKRYRLSYAEEILSQCDKLGIWTISYGSEEYPQRLRNIYNPPMVLYGKGNLGNLDEELSVSVVGTRKASPYGIGVTTRICRDLAKSGFVILSGCAVGIDAAAHRGALEVSGKTIGVLGCGIDVDYPRENNGLKQQILEKGALLSEYPPGTGASGSHFPVRNRILSALSNGVLVTEAPVQSGARITANYALEHGKDLFCVPPHDIFSGSYAGVVPYLREGAKAVYSAEDILFEYCVSYPHKLVSEILSQNRQEKEEIASVPSKLTAEQEVSIQTKQTEAKPTEPQMEPVKLEPKQEKLFSCLSEVPKSADDLAAECGYSIQETLEILMDLELSGAVVSCPGQKYQRQENNSI